MRKIKFSVLMSVYKNDKEEFVKIALDSLIKQIVKANQIVIMIDGPISDDVKKLLLDYEKKESTIELHFRDENKGLGITLNEGLKFCKYDYIARMDADDCCHIDRFEKQINYLLEHPEIDLIGSNIDEYDELLEKKVSVKKVPETNESIYKYIKNRNPFNHMSVVYKKSKVEECGSYLDCQFFEDYYLWCRMAINKCNFYNIQESLLDVRGGLEMIKRRGGKNYNKCIIDFQKKLLKLKLINHITFLKNLTIRLAISSVPMKIRYQFYAKSLRQNNK